MKIIHVGLGDFGLWWCEILHQRMMDKKDITLVAIVDTNEATHQRVAAFGIPCYTSLEDAIAATRPGFILNSTPPAAHITVNRIAHSHNIPVLMEKPISEDHSDVLENLQLAKQGHKLAVAENYRYLRSCIFVRDEIKSKLQNISSINVTFRRHHHMQNYHATMAQPMLIDITTHHIDLLRFFTDSEVSAVSARLTKPSWSWYTGMSNVKAIGEMTSGIEFIYDGALDAFDETSWVGFWTFTAENGVAKFINNQLHLNIGGVEETIQIPQDDEVASKNKILEDFMDYINDSVSPPIILSNQAKNAAVVNAMLTADGAKKFVEVSYD